MKLFQAGGLALGVIALTACRPSLPSVEPATHVEAAPPQTSVQACWIETGRFGGATASGLLVRHPRGDLLIDAGNSTGFDEELQPYHGADKRFLRTLPGALKPDVSLPAALGKAGIAPNALQGVILSHAHIDHAGGLMDLPPTPVWAAPQEVELIERARHQTLFEVVPTHARALEGRLHALAFDDGPYELFERSEDVFDDGSVVAVPMPGHTPGSIAIFVNLADGRRLVHVGDAVSTRRSIDKNIDRPRIMWRTDSDRDRARTGMATLRALVEHSPELEVIPAHERGAWSDALEAPNTPCAKPT